MAIYLISRTRLLAGYESGHVVLYEYEGSAEGVTDARLPEVGSSDGKSGRGRWVKRWKIKGHHEAGECHSSSISFLGEVADSPTQS